MFYDKREFDRAVTWVAVNNDYAASQANPKQWATDALVSLLYSARKHNQGKPASERIAIKSAGFILVPFGEHLDITVDLSVTDKYSDEHFVTLFNEEES